MAHLGNLLCEQVLQFPMAPQTPFDCCRIDGKRIPLNLRNSYVNGDVFLAWFAVVGRGRRGWKGNRRVVEEVRQLRKRVY